MNIEKNQETSEIERIEDPYYLVEFDYQYNPRRRPWNKSKSKIFDIISAGDSRYGRMLDEIGKFSGNFDKIAVKAEGPDDVCPNWSNGWFPGVDAISLYGLLAAHNPRQYIEVGSGNSTKFARQAILDLGLRTVITSIDPCPRASIDSICDRLIRQPFEDVSPTFFDDLTSEDILFVDNSHRSFPNSDVTVFFTEILPYLPGGMIYGLHDIFLPWDYPDEWKSRYYNEQYLLVAYLLGGANNDEIVLPNAYLSYFAPHLLDPLINTLNNPKLVGIEKTGSAFWMRRAGLQQKSNK